MRHARVGGVPLPEAVCRPVDQIEEEPALRERFDVNGALVILNVVGEGAADVGVKIDTRVVQRRLEMDIDSKSVAGRRYYEGRVETSSEAESYKAIVPYLVQALFTDFPGNNGETRKVDVTVPRR